MCQFAQGYLFHCPSRDPTTTTKQQQKKGKNTATTTGGGCGGEFFHAQAIWTEHELLETLYAHIDVVGTLKQTISSTTSTKKRSSTAKDKNKEEERNAYEKAIRDYCAFRWPQRYAELQREGRSVVTVKQKIKACDSRDHDLMLWDCFGGKVFSRYCERCVEESKGRGGGGGKLGNNKGKENWPEEKEEPRRMPMLKVRDKKWLFVAGKRGEWKKTARGEWMRRDGGGGDNEDEGEERERERDSWEEPDEDDDDDDPDDNSHLHRGVRQPRSTLFSSGSSASTSIAATILQRMADDDRRRGPRDSDERLETASRPGRSEAPTGSSATSGSRDYPTTSEGSLRSGGTTVATPRRADDGRSGTTSASHERQSDARWQPRQDDTWSEATSASVISPQHHHTTRSGIPPRANTYRDPATLPSARPSRTTARGSSVVRQETRHVKHAVPGSSDEEQRPNYRKYHDAPWLPDEQRPSHRRRVRRAAVRAASPYQSLEDRPPGIWKYDSTDFDPEVLERPTIPAMDPRPRPLRSSRSRSRVRAGSRDQDRSRSRSSSRSSSGHSGDDKGKRKGKAKSKGKGSDRDSSRRRRKD